MAWMQRILGKNLVSTLAHSAPYSSRFFSKSTPYIGIILPFPSILSLCSAAKVGIPEFVNGIGNGVEAHVAKLESEIGDFHKLLVTRTLKLKKLGIPCKHRKLILKYAHKYRLGLWRPQAQPIKS
ncbi:IGR motif protein [Senna tora]|uniref:IGR motif protein n=1 Tax=Senna tora TaxID=362788 RepID=A0A834W0T4_9FABA|nr:IGR motif protein [Senna tora]